MRGVVEVSEESEGMEGELFWALKGAGWFFGVVVSVQARVYRLRDECLSWTVLFEGGRVREVMERLEGVVNGIEGVVRGCVGFFVQREGLRYGFCSFFGI